jgi:AraC-like DNA-binding protein
MFRNEDIYLSEDIQLISQDGYYAVYQIKSDAGNTTLTCYQLFPGVILIYNDCHTERYHSAVRVKTNTLCIDHCRDGRIEWELSNRGYIYQGAGQMLIHTHEKYKTDFSFPLRHYYGITLNIFIDEAQRSLSAVMDDYSVDLSGIRNKFCPEGYPHPMDVKKLPEHIFSELYDTPDRERLNFYRLKTLELLLHLDMMEPKRDGAQHFYFPKYQIDTIKSIEKFITAHPENRYTLEELSGRFKISLTSMKHYFKCVYGSGIYTYMQTWRMNAASVMLRQTGESVIAIAGSLGYDNPAKFSGAFRKVIGKTPSEYRKDRS